MSAYSTGKSGPLPVFLTFFVVFSFLLVDLIFLLFDLRWAKYLFWDDATMFRMTDYNIHFYDSLKEQITKMIVTQTDHFLQKIHTWCDFSQVDLLLMYFKTVQKEKVLRKKNFQLLENCLLFSIYYNLYNAWTLT